MPRPALRSPLPHPSPLVGEGPGVGGIPGAAPPGPFERPDATQHSAPPAPSEAPATPGPRRRHSSASTITWSAAAKVTGSLLRGFSFTPKARAGSSAWAVTR
jgi:hypothetical protein